MLLLAWYSWSSRKILHGFSNALNSAYAAVGYIKAVTKYRNISVTFLSSKLRIVPLKKFITIPRWELLWNFILPNVIRSAYNSLCEEIFIEEISCCTDSFSSLSSISFILWKFLLFQIYFYFLKKFLSRKCAYPNAEMLHHAIWKKAVSERAICKRATSYPEIGKIENFYCAIIKIAIWYRATWKIVGFYSQFARQQFPIV